MIEGDRILLATLPDYSRTIYCNDVTFRVEAFDNVTGQWNSVEEICQRPELLCESGKGWFGRVYSTDKDWSDYYFRISKSYWENKDIAIEAAKFARTKNVSPIRVSEYIGTAYPIKVIWKNGKWMEE